MSGPYHLLLLSSISILGYLLTLSLVKAGILSKLIHRQIWNVILLTAFLISGILGILLVIQLNYKLEWEFMKPLMVWHVDAGIVLALVAAFHLTWHFTYYLQLFRKSQKTKKNTLSIFPGELPDNLFLLILILGFYATVVQVLLIREITTVFQGNELMIGWTMGIWMFLTGAGSWLGRKQRMGNIRSTIFRLFLLLSYLPIVLTLGMDAGRNIFYPPGEMINPFWFLAIILLILSPVCLLTGYAYSLLITVSHPEESGFVRVYSLESLGSLAGGIAVSFLLIRWFGIIQSLLITAFLVHAATGWYYRRKMLAVSSILILLILILFAVFPLDLKIRSLLFPNQKIMTSRETNFGNITVCENSGEFSFYENGTLLSTTGDVIINEEYIHYAMLQHHHPVNILLVSGGITGMTGEILKYPTAAKVDLVELNPEIIRLARSFKSSLDDRRICVTEGDGRRFIQRTKNKYDVVVFAVPDPSSLQFNRFYTSEFLAVLKEKLREDAVVLFGISPSGNYLSPEKASLESAVYHTLSLHFKNIAVIPGERDFFVASDSPVTVKMGKLAADKKIPTVWVNEEYLDDMTVSQRSLEIRNKIEELKITNSDLKPLPVFYHSLQYISHFSGRNYLIMILPLAFLLLPLFLMNPVSGGMYVTGFTASSVEILLIFWFQTFFGNVYSAIGLIFAIFMGGLAIGSIAGKKMGTSRRHHIGGQILLALYMVGLPLIWKTEAGHLGDAGAWLLFIPILLFPSLLTGFQYVMSTLHYDSDRRYSASSIYAADLWGSALGVILITLILIPVFGVRTSCLILAAMNGLSALFLILSKK